MESSVAKQQLMQKVQAEAQTANMRLLLEKIQENCFTKCVPTPGTSLSSGEKTCVTTCTEKYLQAWNQVNAAFIDRIRKESQ